MPRKVIIPLHQRLVLEHHQTDRTNTQLGFLIKRLKQHLQGVIIKKIKTSKNGDNNIRHVVYYSHLKVDKIHNTLYSERSRILKGDFFTSDSNFSFFQKESISLVKVVKNDNRELTTTDSKDLNYKRQIANYVKPLAVYLSKSTSARDVFLNYVVSYTSIYGVSNHSRAGPII